MTELQPLQNELAVDGRPLPKGDPDLDGEIGIGQGGPHEKPASPSRLALRRFLRHRMAVGSVIVLVVMSILIFFPGLVTDYGPNENTGVRFGGFTGDHPFGTDNISRDELARVLYGGQISIRIGITVALVASIVGTIVGAVAGYVGGWAENLLMRVTDLFLAIPLIVALIIVARLPSRQEWAETLMGSTGSVRSIITILALFFWMPMARIVRGVVLSLKEKEFVEAARAIGASDARILFRHLIPNSVGPILVNITLSVAAAILTESALSFLGFGVQAATEPTWGNLLNAAQPLIRAAPHLVWFPGLAILITVLCVNYVGDGLRDAFDPKQRKA